MSYTTHILPLNGFLFAQKISAATPPGIPIAVPVAFYLVLTKMNFLAGF